jgi:hypothetical protein
MAKEARLLPREYVYRLVAYYWVYTSQYFVIYSYRGRVGKIPRVRLTLETDEGGNSHSDHSILRNNSQALIH